MAGKKTAIKLESLLAGSVILYFFFYEHVQYMFKYSTAYFWCAFNIALACLIFIIHIKQVKQYKECIPWLLVIIISLLNNQVLKHQEYMISFYNYFSAFIAAMILARSDRWVTGGIKVIEKCGMIFAMAVIVLFIVRPLGKVLPMFWGYYPGGTEGGELAYRAGIAPNYSANGIYVATMLIVYACYLLTKNKYDIKYREYCKLILIMIALLLTAKRAHLIFSVAALVFTYFLISNKKNKTVKIVGIAIVAVLLFYLISYFIPALGDTFDRFMQAENEDISNGRFKFWNWAYGQYLEHKAFGIGWFGFRFNQTVSYSETSYFDAHCIYVQLLCESGIVGFSITVFALLFTWIKGVVYIKKYRYSCDQNTYYTLYASSAIQLFCILYGITGNVLYDRCFMIYIICVAMQWAVHNQLKYSNKTRA